MRRRAAIPGHLTNLKRLAERDADVDGGAHRVDARSARSRGSGDSDGDDAGRRTASIFDISDELAVVVEATPERTWHALMNADLIDVARRRPLVGALGALRALPEIVAHALHGESPPSAPRRLTLRDMTELPMSGGGRTPAR